MAGRIKLTFRLRMLVMLLGTCWLLAGALMIFQYHREKNYKTELMNTRLQMHNRRILDDLRRGESAESIVGRTGSPMDSLRVSILDKDGKVVYDSRRPLPLTDHNSRPEVAAARAAGEGYAIARASEEDSRTYFYSALRGDNGTVIRSAAPYTHTLSEFLEVDRTILWIMAALTAAIIPVCLLATRTISVSIRRLSVFADKAERGESIYYDKPFPRDELGSIAANIVKLYVQRDEQHRAAIASRQDKERLKKQLTNNINHELKTPVAAILVSLDLLADHPELDEEKRKAVMERIRANALRLNSLLKDVANISRMDDAAGLIEKKPVELRSLAEELAAEGRLRTDMAITVSMPALTVNGDRRLLESVFRNLIDNAIAYSGATELHITADRHGCFRVWDNGCGIDAAHLPHIFERFYRVDNGRTRSAGGTGLGLAIVRNAIAVHGGDISAFSANGLHFVFTIPTIQN